MSDGRSRASQVDFISLWETSRLGLEGDKGLAVEVKYQVLGVISV